MNKDEKLVKRYGNHAYELLTDKQRAFLLHPDVRDNRDLWGILTVAITRMTHRENTHLYLEDIFRYPSHSTHPGQYSYQRNKVYTRLVRIDPKPVGERYVFELPDTSTISVKYAIIRDTGV